MAVHSFGDPAGGGRVLDAFRVLLVGPVLDRVESVFGSDNILLFTIPHTHPQFICSGLFLRIFHNAWTVVAFEFVASTVLKGIFDYAGTYMVNYAGYGLITDLRNSLYESFLRRSAAFFQKHSTGTLLSTIVSDIERVQFAMSSILAEFLQQFFTFLVTAGVVIVLGRRLAWLLLLFVPFIIFRPARSGAECATPLAAVRTNSPTFRTFARNHHRQSHRKAFSMEAWGSRGSAKLRSGYFVPTCVRWLRLRSVLH